MGGGLGGGSSDAATVLVALDRIWRTGLSTAALCELGARLGADVPVFVLGRDAWATGIGDRLEPMEMPAAHYVIVDPGVAVATGPVFQSPELTRDTAPITISGWLRGARGRNDLEPLVTARFPEVAAAMAWLSARAPARMSGSGACIFAEVTDAVAAAGIIADCPPQWRAHAVQATGSSALLAEAQAY
jgi:4-diphosphocytidyl-2-C-methyl-D-erythritol kinase